MINSRTNERARERVKERKMETETSSIPFSTSNKHTHMQVGRERRKVNTCSHVYANVARCAFVCTNERERDMCN